MGLSVKSKLQDLLNHPGAAAVLEEYMPGISTEDDPNIKKAMGFSLKIIANMASDKLNPSLLPEIDAKLQALGD